MRIKGTLLIILVASLGTAWAMTVNEQEDTSSDVVSAVTKAATHDLSGSTTAQTPEVHFDLARINRPMPKSIRATGLFESKSWYVPPPAPAYLPPPQPTAPPLLYVFIGRMVDGNEVTLFLSKNDRRYAVKEKDVLDDFYRIDKIDEGNAVLTYLPTNTQQTLSFNTSTATSSLISASELKTAMIPATPTSLPSSN